MRRTASNVFHVHAHTSFMLSACVAQDMFKLNQQFERFYTRHAYTPIRDCWERPICSLPGARIDVMDRFSNDGNWTYMLVPQHTHGCSGVVLVCDTSSLLPPPPPFSLACQGQRGTVSTWVRTTTWGLRRTLGPALKQSRRPCTTVVWRAAAPGETMVRGGVGATA